jgi:Domain of unknown function (DUF4192)
MSGSTGTRKVIVPADAEELAAVKAEGQRAAERVRRFLSRPEYAGQLEPSYRALARRGIHAVTNVVKEYRSGGPVPHPATVAWLLLVLDHLPVRDHAWALMEHSARDAHRRMWLDLTRRACPGYVAAPASLLAFVAWQDEDRDLARAAVDLALDDTEDYSMATTLHTAINWPSSFAIPPMTPLEAGITYGLTESPAPGEPVAAT